MVFSRPFETQGYKFYVLKPLPSDYILHMTRKTQIIYPEDAGLILLYTGIGPGSIVIEAGCGSGALTCILGNIVRPKGHIYSYDIREKSLKRAKLNVKRAKLDDFVSIQYGDILNDDLKLENVDAVVLDMATPWNAIEKVLNYLKFSGTLVSFSPTIEQVKKTVSAMKNNEFIEVNTYELIKRRIQVKEKKIEYKTLFDNFIEEKKSLQKSKKATKDNKQFLSIKQVERKIDNLERIIETEKLDIAEENALIDQIRELAAMKQEFFSDEKNNELFKIERKIEIVKINLNKIYEQLNKWSDKSQENHTKMLEEFQNVDNLKEDKKKQLSQISFQLYHRTQ
ncbi:unnamed protein product [marine sediment metagenome]|uniref:tRNA (adenine(58)-N(1))-methyltransferase catalytic subunit TRM61 C-terminal domain-containing protein n=2 Tax=marine sediment metagenome TaxID=412755 RepID=X1ABZ8_9ZZZZ